MRSSATCQYLVAMNCDVLIRLVTMFLLIAAVGCDSADPPSPELAVTEAFSSAVGRMPSEVRHVVEKPDRYEMPDIMGAGCALLDFDRDGRLDLFLVSAADASESVASERLYRQTSSGDLVDTTFRLEDELAGTGMGVTVGDFNNDGWPDIYETRFGEDRLLLNVAATGSFSRGFKDVSETAGISNLRWGTSACCVDFDRDGWLDLFVTNYVDYVPQECVQLSGVNRDFCGPQQFNSSPDRLFRNVTGELAAEGAIEPDTLAFEDVTVASGIASLHGAGLGVVAVDFTDDGWPDIYVANDQQPNFLWVNQQDGTFREQAVPLGCASDALGNAQASMGIAVYDFDSDQKFDLLITHLDGERNTLYLRTADGGFRDASSQWGPSRESLPTTGFGIACLESPTPGKVDIVVANGRVRRPDGTNGNDGDFWMPYRQMDMLYEVDVTGRDGLPANCESKRLSAAPAVSRGLAAGDLNGDRWQDVVMTTVSDDVVLLTHALAPESHILTVRAIDPKLGGRDALGAIVTAVTNRGKLVRLVQTCGSYLSASEPAARFCVFSTDDDWPTHLLVDWPDGSRERFDVPNIELVQVLEHGRGAAAE